MTKTILLDANLLISAFDTKEKVAVEAMRKLLKDDSISLAITPLIRYEVLRSVEFTDDVLHEKLKERLNGFEEFDITRDISELSTALFRYAKSEGKVNPENVNKRSFDIFHWATAKCNELEIESNDGDIDRLETLYDEYTKRHGS